MKDLVRDEVFVRMAEMQVCKGDEKLVCIGIGSCIAFCAYDPIAKVGGMAHIMLPSGAVNHESESPAKFANTAITELLQHMKSLGAIHGRIRVVFAGGAHVFGLCKEAINRMDIGLRNAQAVEELTRKQGLNVVARHVGGGMSRSVTMFIGDGKVIVRTVPQTEVLQCSLTD